MVVPGRSVLMTQDSALSRAAARPTLRGSPGVKNWDREGERKLSKRRLSRTKKTGDGMCAKTIEGWGGGTEERKGHGRGAICLMEISNLVCMCSFRSDNRTVTSFFDTSSVVISRVGTLFV